MIRNINFASRFLELLPQHLLINNIIFDEKNIEPGGSGTEATVVVEEVGKGFRAWRHASGFDIEGEG